MRQPDHAAAVLRLALPAPDLDLIVDPDAVVLTPHAVQRYREPIDGVGARLAVRRLRVLVATARWRSRPAAWPQVVLHPEVIYGYSGTCLGACLLLRNQVLVTVLACDRPDSVDIVDSRSGQRHREARGRPRWRVSASLADGGRVTPWTVVNGRRQVEPG